MIFLRLIPLTLVLISFAFPAAAGELSPLRHFVWGATPEDVRKFETATFYKKDATSEYYVEQLDDFNRTIRYDFKDGELWRGYYGYNELDHPDSMMIMQRAADFQIVLEQIYGKPTTDELVWKNTRYRGNSNWLGAAMRSGDVKVRVTWMLPGTKVVMEAYDNGAAYELNYTAEKVEPPRDMDHSRNILNLPQTSGTAP